MAKTNITTLQRTIAYVLLTSQLLTSCGGKQEMIIPNTFSNDHQENWVEKEDCKSTISAIEEIKASSVTNQVHEEVTWRSSPTFVPVSQPMFQERVDARLKNKNTSSTHKRMASKPYSIPVWQRVALFGIAMNNTFAYASRPYTFNKEPNHNRINGESDNTAQVSQSHDQPVKLEDDLQISNDKEEAIHPMLKDELIRREKIWEEYKARQLKEIQEKFEPIIDRKISFIEKDDTLSPFSVIFKGITGLTVMCDYDTDMATKSLVSQFNNSSDAMSHASFGEFCKIHNEGPDPIDMGFVQKIEKGSSKEVIASPPGSPPDSVLEVRTLEDTFDSIPKCDEESKKCYNPISNYLIDDILFYEHIEIIDKTPQEHISELILSTIKPGETKILYLADIPRIGCLHSFYKYPYKGVQTRYKANPHSEYKPTSSTNDITELTITAGGNVYEFGTPLTTTMNFRFLDMLLARNPLTKKFIVGDKGIRWFPKIQCRVKGVLPSAAGVCKLNSVSKNDDTNKCDMSHLDKETPDLVPLKSADPMRTMVEVGVIVSDTVEDMQKWASIYDGIIPAGQQVAHFTGIINHFGKQDQTKLEADAILQIRADIAITNKK